MIENVPSKTAYRVAMRRAAHQLLDSPVVFDDPFALRIIAPADAAELRANPGQYDQSRLARYLRAFLCARSRWAEDELGRAVASGVRQYVLLGAGLDTFAYRNPHAALGLRVFEVDHPATQQWKRERVREGGLTVPDSLTFVPVDFETQQLGDQLLRAGLRRDEPSFFAWLGVVPYLSLASVMSTLRYIVSVAGMGGGVVFDYATPPSELSFSERLAFELMAARVNAAGEPWQTYFSTNALVHELRGVGFRSAVSTGPAEINARFFRDRRDGLKVGSLGHFMMAMA
jgi:methyltransferase (TIGR00027 family)